MCALRYVGINSLSLCLCTKVQTESQSVVHYHQHKRLTQGHEVTQMSQTGAEYETSQKLWWDAEAKERDTKAS